MLLTCCALFSKIHETMTTPDSAHPTHYRTESSEYDYPRFTEEKSVHFRLVQATRLGLGSEFNRTLVQPWEKVASWWPLPQPRGWLPVRPPSPLLLLSLLSWARRLPSDLALPWRLALSTLNPQPLTLQPRTSSELGL